MNRNKFLKQPRPTHNFCPDCGELITWVSKDVCPCKIKLGWEVHETIAEPIYNGRMFDNFVMQDPPPTVNNDRGRVSLDPFEIVSNPTVRWDDIFQRYNVMDRARERAQMQNSQASPMQWDNTHFPIGE